MANEFKTLKVSGGEHGRTLQEFLCERLGCSRKQAKRVLDGRFVFVNRQRVWMARHPLEAGDLVEVRSPAAQAPAAPAALRVLHEDDDYLVVDKPAGLLANGPRSAEALLRTSLRNEGLEAVHRLDRDTSGCFLLAKSHAAFEAMVQVFQERAVTKVYLAIACGRMAHGSRTLRTPIDGQEAVTHLRTMRTSRFATLLQLRLETGRTHQIRRHLAADGHPLAGDKQYQTAVLKDDELRRVPRQMLHAGRLSFTHPRTGQVVDAEAPLPLDFVAAKRELGLG